MAKLCGVCSSLCAYFIIFFRITQVLSIDGYFFYAVPQDLGSEYQFTTKLLDHEEELPLQKRDVENNQSNSPLPNESSIGTQNRSRSVDDDVPVVDKAPADNKVSSVETRNYMYYKSTIQTDSREGDNYWIDLTNHSINELSNSYNKAIMIQLSFEFPFYGQLIKTVAIATAGFILPGDLVDERLSVSPYIAPLMANFHSGVGDDSNVRYVDNGTAFTVEWMKLYLYDQPLLGKFSFQTTLYKNGDIVFVYQNVPFLTNGSISAANHAVNVGISDALVTNGTDFDRLEKIHEYHRIKFGLEDVKNWTVIYFKALPTCLRNEDCSTCTTANIPSLECSWCPSINRCLDRNRQNWPNSACQNECLTKESLCPYLPHIPEKSNEFQKQIVENHSSVPKDTGYKHEVLTNSIDIRESHSVQKRDVQNNQSNSPVTSNSTTLFPMANNTTGAQIQTGNVVDSTPVVNKTSTDNDIASSKTKSGKVGKPSLSINTGQLQVPQKNLVVNGSGQYINISSVKPQLQMNATSIVSVDQNVTAIKNDTEDDITINNCADDDESEALNKTLADHNITTIKKDNHMYYNSTLRTDAEVGRYYWVDLANVKVNELLSRSHRRAATVQLSFEFPFYGHYIKNVTIATGGFLYTGDYVHSWLAATQYIAPLMANFDTSISNDSFIRYVDNGTAFTVEWEKVSLRDKPNVGEFTFQTTLHKSGDIVFVYQNVPLFIKSIEDDHHPVKVGLSDAYIIDRTIFLVRRKTIYEYHRINFLKEDIKNWTVIYLTALPTCLQNEDCNACTTSTNTSFECQWCPSINHCSNGVDRHRQDWLTKGCDKKRITDESQCSHMIRQDFFDNGNLTYDHNRNEFQPQMEEGSFQSSSRTYNNASPLGSTHPVKMGVSSIVAILFLIAMVAGLVVWVLYAYRNPHTTSGQILIRYRPSQWRWRRGEARYTAATIHM